MSKTIHPTMEPMDATLDALDRVRSAALSLAGFHGYLELAVVAYLLNAGPALRMAKR